MGTYYIVEEALRAYESERRRDTVETSEHMIPDTISRSPKRFWDSLSLSMGAIEQLAVVSFDALTG